MCNVHFFSATNERTEKLPDAEAGFSGFSLFDLCLSLGKDLFNCVCILKRKQAYFNKTLGTTNL